MLGVTRALPVVRRMRRPGAKVPSSGCRGAAPSSGCRGAAPSRRCRGVAPSRRCICAAPSSPQQAMQRCSPPGSRCTGQVACRTSLIATSEHASQQRHTEATGSHTASAGRLRHAAPSRAGLTQVLLHGAACRAGTQQGFSRRLAAQKEASSSRTPPTAKLASWSSREAGRRATTTTWQTGLPRPPGLCTPAQDCSHRPAEQPQTSSAALVRGSAAGFDSDETPSGRCWALKQQQQMLSSPASSQCASQARGSPEAWKGAAARQPASRMAR